MGRASRTAAGITAAGLVAVLGYGALDAYDIAPGVLTTKPQVVVDPVPQPRAHAAAVELAAPLSADAPVPGDIAAAIDPILDDASIDGNFGYDIRDAMTGEVLYARDDTRAQTPASVTKVLTAAAALSSLGADARFTTTTALDGTHLHLIGGGDVLLGAGESDPEQTVGHAGLGTLAEQTAAQLGERGVSAVTLSADLSRYSGPDFSPGWDRADIGNGYIAPIVPLMVDSAHTGDSPGDPRQADPAGAAVEVFAEALSSHGISVTAAGPQESPEDAEPLAEVASAPMGSVVAHMLIASDNVSAETLGREVALARGVPASAAEAPPAVIAALADAGLPTGSISLADVSGLDYDNRISAHDLTNILLAAAESDSDLSRLIPSMPVGGLSGTLSPRYRDEETKPAAGLVTAKTGTLATVTSLAGTVMTADGRLLVFSMMVDGFERGEAGAARVVVDRSITALTACGCGGS